MRLIRLKINNPSGFRSLQAGFEVCFLREWDYDKANQFNPNILVGPNGSGKSNVLEALAAIFYHIDCMLLEFRPDTFEYDEEQNPNGFQVEKSIPNAFEVEYFMRIPPELNQLNQPGFAHISIVKNSGEAPVIQWVNRREFNNEGDQRLNDLEAKSFYPRFVLGYSSGENEILSLPFFKTRFIQFDEYWDFLIRDDYYNQEPESRLVYLDQQFSQAILLSNFLFHSKSVLSPLKEEIGLEKILEFRIIIKGKSLSLSEEAFSEGFSKGFESKHADPIILTKKLEGIIEKLKNCATATYLDTETDTWYLDYWVNEATREAFRLHFGSALELFQTFQILLTLNLYQVTTKTKQELYGSDSVYVNETIPIPPSDERIMRFKDFVLKKTGTTKTIYSKSLSDGEHQFSHALGLCLLFKNEPCLFLLDEPETHFNPDWRASFISRLRDCFKEGDAADIMRDMLITTHSPFLVSDSKPEYVFMFNKETETQKITSKQPDFNTFGASINKITLKAFAKPETIGGFAGQKLQELRQRFKAGENAESILNEVNREMGDSIEKTLFINELFQSRKD
ncbi:restriction system-associated AAA family ATPase [bacterium]|nr:restriction system-associated AAA family ATPase [bacterium]